MLKLSFIDIQCFLMFLKDIVKNARFGLRDIYTIVQVARNILCISLLMLKIIKSSGSAKSVVQ